MQVKDVMTPDPQCCTPDTPLTEVAQLMVDCDCGEIPVVDNKTNKAPVGVVTDRDIVCRVVAKGQNPQAATAGACMTAPVITVTPDMSIDECCQAMEDKLIRRVPVVDDNGAVVGIVALADIARLTKKSVAGEIVKEVSEPTSAASAASGK
jgi:CBS domain-containing protein